MLTQADLDSLGCSDPDCAEKSHNELVFRNRCHPKRGTFAWYEKNTGTLSIKCAACEDTVLRIAVAPGAEHQKARH